LVGRCVARHFGMAIRIMARGASGGSALAAFGSTPTMSYGAVVRAVFSLTAGTSIYFLVGQEGASAVREVSCPEGGAFINLYM